MQVGPHRVTVLVGSDGNPINTGFPFPMDASRCAIGSPFIINVTSAQIDAARTTVSVAVHAAHMDYRPTWWP